MKETDLVNSYIKLIDKNKEDIKKRLNWVLGNYRYLDAQLFQAQMLRFDLERELHKFDIDIYLNVNVRNGMFLITPASEVSQKVLNYLTKNKILELY